MIECARVCMVTYGDSAASLPALLHGGLSLASAGFQVDSLHSDAAPPSADQNAPGFRSHRFPLRTRSALRTLRARGPATRAIAAILQLLSYCEFIFRAAVAAYRMRADVYEAHDLPALLPTLLAARLRGKPLIYRANEIFSEGHPHVPFARFWRGLDRLLVPHCDEVVTPEEHRSRIYRDEYGAKKEPLTVRNCPPYRPPVESTRLRDELRRRGVAFSTIVLYQGLIDPMRCIEELAEATRSFDEGVVLVVLGKGFGSWSDPQARLAGYGRMVVLPRVPYPELASYTASADVGILLYRNNCRNNYYCAPNKLFEYMMMGLPVIAPSFPGIVPIVEGGKTGVCVDPAQPKQIASAVNELARAPELRQRMRENGLRLSRERYNWETEFAPMLERYRALVAPAGAREVRPSTSP
jgi:glycosyltransferase involved in cell wall biosynthesis